MVSTVTLPESPAYAAAQVFREPLASPAPTDAPFHFND
jgi:hypothetical protein